MFYNVTLFCESTNNLKNFLKLFFSHEINLKNELYYEKEYGNPIDMIELITTIIDNNNKFNIAIWINIDKNIYINVTENNLEKIIRYLLERYPT